MKGDIKVQKSILYDHFTVLPYIRGHFDRPRIDKLLTEALNCPLILVTAGAGWGKTQAVSFFLHNSDNRYMWMQFSELDNYTVRFWESFTHALNAQCPEFARKLLAFGFPDSASLFHNFIYTFADLTVNMDKCILVFDDVHLIRDLSILQFINNLICARLKNLTIVVMGRFLSDLDIKDFHNNDAVFRLTEEDLRFTPKEVWDYFSNQGITLLENTFEEIYRITNGWISGLYLISLSFKKNRGSQQDMLIVARRQIFYLIEQEIFSKYPLETQHILVKFALLERIPVGFIKKYFNLDLMNEIEKTNQFIRFNPMTNTYDIHSLFLDFLLERQGAFLSDDELKEVHLKIADWYYINDSQIEALTHYQACGHYEQIWKIIRQYEMQAPASVCRLFLDLIEGFPIEFGVKYPLTAVIHARLLLVLRRHEDSIREFTEIMNKYEALPATKENKAILGETFIYLGMISLLSFDGRYLELFKKADEYLPDGSSIIDNRFSFYEGNFMILINKDTPGEMDRHIKTVMEAMPYAAKVMNGGGYGIEYVVKAEAAYYVNNMKEAESVAYMAIYKSEQQRQYDTACVAYFVLIRVYVSAGNYSKAADCIEQLENKIAVLKSDSEKVLNIRRYVYTYTILKSWYYSMLGEYDQIPDWILKQEARHKVPLKGFYLRDEFIHAYYLLDKQEYEELSGLLEALSSDYDESGLLIARIYIHILKAILAQKKGHIAAAMEELRTSYNLSCGNSLVMPFVEYGKYMRTLIYSAKHSVLNTIPDTWLDEISTKATTYEKHQNSIKAQYRRLLGNGLKSAAKLTKMEREMIRYLCQGLTNREIANARCISLSAVKKMLNNIYVKLEAVNRADAVRIAIQMELYQ